MPMQVRGGALPRGSSATTSTPPSGEIHVPGPVHQLPPDDLPRSLPTSPSGRIPQWVLDEAAGRPPADTRFRSWEPGPTRLAAVTRLRPRRRGRRVLAAVVALAVVAVGAFVVLDRRADDATAAAGTATGTGGVTSSSYVFLHTEPVTGEPIGYDPCTPIRFEVRPEGAPPDGDAMVDEAIASVAAVTGLTFQRVGTTSRGPWDDAAVAPMGFGQWDPVLVAWSDPVESPTLEGRVAGYARSVPAARAGGSSYLRTGEVVLDGPGAEALLRRSDGRQQVVAILTHEVGHLVGLDHVDDPTQLMHAENSGLITRFGAGDLAGLRALGEIACEG
ncbi:hypothetical protein GCM10028777_25290 [Angustibacter speluncae]